MDYGTRWGVCKPGKNMDADTVARFLYHDIYGASYELISDRGTLLLAEIIKSY